MNVDEIAQKRAEMKQKRATEDAHKENISAVTDSGKNVVKATSALAKSEDIDSIIKQLKEIQLTTLLNARSNIPEKPSVILTDQTDLGDKISELTQKLTETIKGLDISRANTEQLQAIKELQTVFVQYKSAINTDSAKAQKELIQAVNSIKVSPVVQIPAPKVTVQPASVDLSPLQDTIKEYFKPPQDENTKTDLSCYRAQDIDNTNPNVQYIGFVNPDGDWYIIENDVAGNKMRYLFGTVDYENAFQRAATYTYLLLNEAIHAISV